MKACTDMNCRVGFHGGEEMKKKKKKGNKEDECTEEKRRDRACIFVQWNMVVWRQAFECAMRGACWPATAAREGS